MAWPKFLVFNTAGAILWATIYGFGAYYLGHELEHVTKLTAAALGVIGILVLILIFILTMRHEAELTAKAEAALPGPIMRRRRRST